jgi:colicin import membrane protein
MKVETASRASGGKRLQEASVRWVTLLSLALLGLVLGAAGYQAWKQAQARHRLSQAREQAEVLFAAAGPQVEGRLERLARQVEGLQKELGRAPAANRSESVELTRYRVQLKRLQLEIGGVESALEQLISLRDGAPERFALRPGQEVLDEEQRTQLAAWQGQVEQLWSGLALLAPEVELARERRVQLAAAETEVTLRAETTAEAERQAQAEAARQAQAEAAQRARAETTRLGQSETTPPSYPATPPAAWLEPVFRTRSSPESAGVRYVQAAPIRFVRPLVIGSTYPDRFIGYRNGYRCGPYPFLVGPPPPPLWCW